MHENRDYAAAIAGPAPFTGMAPPATQQLFPIGSGPPAQAADGQLPPPVTFPAAVPHVVTPRPEPLFPIAAAADGAAPMPQPPIPAGMTHHSLRLQYVLHTSKGTPQLSGQLAKTLQLPSPAAP